MNLRRDGRIARLDREMEDRQKTSNESPPTRVGLIGLGCAKNRVDGEVMLGHIKNAGAEITSDADQADVVVVNTCGFITDAE
jgi:hypothetical protein